MMAMKKNVSLTTRGIVKKRRKSQVTEHEAGVTKKASVLNRSRDVLDSLEPESSNSLASEYPVIDTERVETIKRAIEKGDYRIDCNRTAEKLLKLEDEIWGKERD